MASAVPQPRLLDPTSSPVLEAREIMARFPKRWVFIEVTDDYEPREFDGFRGRVLAEAPTRKLLTPLIRAVWQRWHETGYNGGTFALWTAGTPPKRMGDLSADVDE
jgi:hypothetical protein